MKVVENQVFKYNITYSKRIITEWSLKQVSSNWVKNQWAQTKSNRNEQLSSN